MTQEQQFIARLLGHQCPTNLHEGTGTFEFTTCCRFKVVVRANRHVNGHWVVQDSEAIEL